MNKATKYAINGAVIGGAAGAMINLLQQSKNGQPLDGWLLFNELLKCAMLGGSVGLIIGAVKDYYNGLESPRNVEAILLAYASKIKLTDDNRRYQQLKSTGEWLMKQIKNEFSDQLVRDPFLHGSTVTGTAHRDYYDLDICVPLKSGGFANIDDMFDEVAEFIESLVGTNNISGSRVQKRTIGLFVRIAGEEYKIDILSLSVTRKRGNFSCGYVATGKNQVFRNTLRTKTDPHLLRSVQIGKNQKELIVLLKEWKKKNGVPISSPLLQYMVLDAYQYNRGHIPRDFIGKLLMVINHIQMNIHTARIRGVENSNNILTDIPENAKENIYILCKSAIDEYDYQPNSLIKTIARNAVVRSRNKRKLVAL